MKKITALLFCMLIVVFSTVSANCAVKNKLSVSAESYVLYCADNGKVLLSNNMNKKMKPASTTKIMTALLTLEQAKACNKKVTFTKEMQAQGSSMYLKLGDTVALSDLATGMMMSSGNDAANAAALTISSSFEKFSKLMNNRAKQIGMKNTHFVTPSGLDDDNHYSTAYDMALLMDYALENEDFAKLTSQKSVSVNFLSPSDKVNSYLNHNRLLSMYKYCISGKTGYTIAAGRCLVTAAKKDGLTLICVTMNDKKDWNDHISLYDYGFENYARVDFDADNFCEDVDCVGGKKDKVTVTCENSKFAVVLQKDKDKIKKTVYLDNFLYAPIKENQVVGKIIYTLDNKKISEMKLVSAEENNSQQENKDFLTIIKDWFTYG